MKTKIKLTQKILLAGGVSLLCGLSAKAQTTTSYQANSIPISTTGGTNTGFGVGTLASLSSGYNNDASGYNTLFSTTTGHDNAGHGVYALTYNTSGNYNTGTGSNALPFNTTGSKNTAHGYKALFANVDGSLNTANGSEALVANTTGTVNVAVGALALSGMADGVANVAVGYRAGDYLSTSGSNNNTFLGAYTEPLSSSISNATAVGYGAIVCNSNTMMFGSNYVQGWGFGNSCPTASQVFIVGTGSSNGNGAYLTAGGTWTNTSDRNKKENIKEVNGADILKKINELPISVWNYKGEPNAPKHIGPMAQDFFRIFSVGNDDVSISTIDPSGVALAGIKELSKEVDELKKQNAKLQELVQALMTSNSMAEVNRQSVQLGNSAVVLNQNVPNPFAEQTLISYNVPQNAGSAQVLFYNASGTLIKTVDIAAKGAGQLTVFANDLSGGLYTYTLVVDGKVVDTKKMIKN